MGRKKLTELREERQAERAEKKEERQERRQERIDSGALRPVDILIRGGKILGRFLAMRGSNMLIKKGLNKIEVPASDIEKIIEIKNSVMRNVFLK